MIPFNFELNKAMCRKNFTLSSTTMDSCDIHLNLKIKEYLDDPNRELTDLMHVVVPQIT